MGVVVPKRALRILFLTFLALPLAAVAAEQQGTGNAKPVAQRAPAPPTLGKISPTSRDVCGKHPNLKQCS